MPGEKNRPADFDLDAYVEACLQELRPLIKERAVDD